VLPTGGDPRIAAAIDPVAGGGDACVATAAGDQPGTATYRLPPAPTGGYTLLGSPTVVAELALTGRPGIAQLAARLWDVAPGGASQALVARGLYRPSGRGTEVFQLHPNGYRFERGHVAKLELLGNDAPYGRPSNAPSRVEVERLELRLPVRGEPDCRTVLPAAAPVVPEGQQLAPGAVRRGARDCERDREERTGRDRRRAERDTGSGPGGGNDGGIGGPGEGAARDEGAGELPFTGLALGAVIGVGVLLLLGGAALRARREMPWER
jgi:hypothetical protein